MGRGVRPRCPGPSPPVVERTRLAHEVVDERVRDRVLLRLADDLDGAVQRRLAALQEELERAMEVAALGVELPGLGEVGLALKVLRDARALLDGELRGRGCGCG